MEYTPSQRYFSCRKCASTQLSRQVFSKISPERPFSALQSTNNSHRHLCTCSSYSTPLSPFWLTRIRRKVDLSLFRKVREKDICLANSPTSSSSCRLSLGRVTLLVICLRWYKKSSWPVWSLRMAFPDSATLLIRFPCMSHCIPHRHIAPAPSQPGSKPHATPHPCPQAPRIKTAYIGSRRRAPAGREQEERRAHCPATATGLIICLLDPCVQITTPTILHPLNTHYPITKGHPITLGVNISRPSFPREVAHNCQGLQQFKLIAVMQDKNYTKMILERLSRKAQQQGPKQDALSTLKTQATLHDTSHSHSQQDTPTHPHPSHLRAFFDAFEHRVEIKHDPVICPMRRPLRRCLFYELAELQFKKDTVKPARESRRKLVTLPSSPYFQPEQQRPAIRSVARQSIAYDQRPRETPIPNPYSVSREARPYVSTRKGQKMEVYTKVNSKVLQRYKSMRVL